MRSIARTVSDADSRRQTAGVRGTVIILIAAVAALLGLLAGLALR